MIKFKYCLQIRGIEVCCLGSQIGLILSLLPQNKQGYWFGRDISTNISNDENVALEFENRDSLISYTKTVDQFLSGVFLLMKGNIKIDKNAVNTEDPPFRNDLKALLEIRTFDTSYIEIYANDYDFLEKLQSELPETIFKSPNIILKNE